VPRTLVNDVPGGSSSIELSPVDLRHPPHPPIGGKVDVEVDPSRQEGQVAKRHSPVDNDCPHKRKAEGAHLAAFVSCRPLLDSPLRTTE